MIEARVAAVPMPRSFMASESAWLSSVLPADSMAVSKVASVNRGGGLVRFLTASASCTSTVWPWRKPPGRSGSDLGSRLPLGLTSSTFQPGSSTALPVERNWSASALCATRVIKVVEE